MDRFCPLRRALCAAQRGVVMPEQHDDSLAVHLATELYDGQGGHSLALKDVIRARPDLRHVVIVTNLHQRPFAAGPLWRKTWAPVCRWWRCRR